MNREKLDKTRNHAILKTEKSLGTRLERLEGGLRRKNVMSMRELFCPDPLAGFEKMAGF